MNNNKAIKYRKYNATSQIKGIIEFVLISLDAILGAFLRYKITSIPFIFVITGSNVMVVNIIRSFILEIFSIFSSSLKNRFQIFFFNSHGVMRFVDYHVIDSIRRYSIVYTLSNNTDGNKYDIDCSIIILVFIYWKNYNNPNIAITWTEKIYRLM